jgi:uncharacterized protein (TIGR02453 family)
MIDHKLLTFLGTIKKNNNKEWYEEHKDEYKLLRLTFTAQLEQIRDEITTFDKAVKRNHKKGIRTVKVFRLHRDARFSRNKAKYKTNLSGLISADVKDPSEPVYYFSVEPGNKSFFGGGIRTPEREHLHHIREHISSHYKKLEKILANDSVTNHFPGGLSDEHKLKKAPQGYDIGHPGIDLLRYKNFTIGQSLADTDLKDTKIIESISNEFAVLVELNAFLRAAGNNYNANTSTKSATSIRESLLASHFEM